MHSRWYRYPLVLAEAVIETKLTIQLLTPAQYTAELCDSADFYCGSNHITIGQKFYEKFR